MATIHRPFLMLAALAVAGPSVVAQPIALSLAGNRVAVAGGGQAAVKVLDVPSGKEQWAQKLKPLTVHPKSTPIGSVSALAFSPDGKTLAVGGGILYHGHAALLDAATGKLLWVKRDVGEGERVSVAFSPDGKTICAGDCFGAATLLDAKTGESRRALEAKGVTAVAFSPDGKLVAGACQDTRGGGKAGREVRLWDAATGKLLRTLPGGSGAVAFAPDGKTLATAGDDDAVALWDVKTGQLKRAAKGKPAGLIVFSPDGKAVAVVEGRAGPLTLRDAQTGERLRTLADGDVGDVAFSPDGKTVVAWGLKSGVKRWEVAKPLEPAFAGALRPGARRGTMPRVSPAGLKESTG